MRLRHLLTVAILSVSVLCAPVGAAVVKFKTSGTYNDGSGTDHNWSVNDAHTLIWDGQPYLPVGAVFVAKSLSVGAPESAYADDVAALDALKAQGITDVIVHSGGPMTSADPAALQKLIAHLDSGGFTYGIELADRPKEPLRGYLVSLARYKLEGPSNDASLSFKWPSADSAIYVVVDRTTNQITSSGGAVVRDGKAVINLTDPLNSSQVLLVLPHLSVADSGDLWGGFGEYRDRVVAFLKNVKFGQGLRFFMEPFTGKMDFTGDMVGFIPDSSGFRVGFEAYLAKKRIHEGSVNATWGLNDSIDSLETAARLIPLWGFGRGVSYAYDRATSHLYSVDTTLSEYWRDLTDYRDTSAQEMMNTMSDTLRKQIANVPVVFRSAKYHRVYANPFGYGGFDGLGVDASGTDDNTISKTAGPVYALAEESGKSTWFIADAQAADVRPAAGYSNETSMAASLGLLKELGAKGFFVDGLTSAQGAWLKSFKDKVKPAQLSDFKPEVVSYPIAPLTGAYPKRLAPGTWWLPTLRVGQTTFVGDGLGAYTIAGEDRTYIWSGAGSRTLTFKAGSTGTPTIEFPPNTSVAKKKDGSFAVAATSSPTVMRGLEFALAFPFESANAEIDALSALIPQADKAGMNVKKFQEGLERSKTVLGKGQGLVAYGIAQSSIQEMLTVLGAPIWQEAELSAANNFDGPAPLAGASANLALVLDTPEDPPMTPYSAAFAFETPANSSYEVWVAATPPGDGSPLSYTVDDSGWTAVAAEAGTLQSYAPGLSWYKIGTANLRPDRHTLKLRVDGKRAGGDKYYCAIDAVVMSPKAFKPNGVAKPF